MLRPKNVSAPSGEILRLGQYRALGIGVLFCMFMHPIKEVVPHLTFSIGPPLFSREKEREVSRKHLPDTSPNTSRQATLGTTL